MGFEVTLTSDPAGQYAGPINAITYNYSEDASPLSGADSTGSVGSFSVTIPVADMDVPAAQRHPVWSIQALIGDAAFIDAIVTIFDSRKGITSGFVRQVERSRTDNTITLSGVTRLALVNTFNVQAQPFVGTLAQAVAYYLGLAGVTSGFTVDTTVAAIPVAIPGWSGELWYRIKQLVSAYACDISLVSNVILVRPVRKRIAQKGRDITRNQSTGGYSLAQAVEVYQYNNRAITGELVYPPQAPSVEDQVFNVNAGEIAEYTLSLSSSLSSFDPVEIITTMDISYTASSAVVISGNDGQIITSDRWTLNGGRIELSISESTQELNLLMYAPTGMRARDGGFLTSFSLSTTDRATGNRYSTLRVVGSGVAFNKVKHRVRTGVPASKASTDVGVTIDNPFTSTMDDVARVGLAAARQFSGTQMTLSGSVVSINRRGDSGQVTLPTYAQIQVALITAIGLPSPTYDQVQAYYNSLGLTTYEDIQNYWNAYFSNPDVDQLFGNVQGARIYDEPTRRWYRIRNANLTPEGINFDEAEDDLLYADFQEKNAGMTYAQIEAKYAGMTYRQVELAGLI